MRLERFLLPVKVTDGSKKHSLRRTYSPYSLLLHVSQYSCFLHLIEHSIMTSMPYRYPSLCLLCNACKSDSYRARICAIYSSPCCWLLSRVLKAKFDSLLNCSFIRFGRFRLHHDFVDDFLMFLSFATETRQLAFQDNLLLLTSPD